MELPTALDHFLSLRIVMYACYDMLIAETSDRVQSLIRFADDEN